MKKENSKPIPNPLTKRARSNRDAGALVILFAILMAIGAVNDPTFTLFSIIFAIIGATIVIIGELSVQGILTRNKLDDLISTKEDKN